MSGKSGESLPAFADEEVRKSAAIHRIQAAIPFLPIQDVSEELAYMNSEWDPQGIAHLRFQQVFQNIPVRNGEIRVHLYPDGQYIINGRPGAISSPPATSPTLSSSDAASIALANVNLHHAFNRISSTTTTDIEYWDIGVLRAWDNSTDYFSDGLITKIFSSLDQGESVGNPVFSTNSPNVIAFDYINSLTGENSILAANIELGQIGTIFTQSVLGVLAYSNTDDKIIFNAEDTQGNEVVGVIDLAVDKINAAGSQASVLIPDAKWGIWIAQGSRDINLSQDLQASEL